MSKKKGITTPNFPLLRTLCNYFPYCNDHSFLHKGSNCKRGLKNIFFSFFTWTTDSRRIALNINQASIKYLKEAANCTTLITLKIFRGKPSDIFTSLSYVLWELCMNIAQEADVAILKCRNLWKYQKERVNLNWYLCHRHEKKLPLPAIDFLNLLNSPEY